MVQLLVQWTVQQRFIGNEGKEEQTILNQFAFSTSLPGHQARIDIHHKRKYKLRHRASNRARICTQFCHYIVSFWMLYKFLFAALTKTKIVRKQILPFIQSLSQQQYREIERKKTDANSKLTNDRAAFQTHNWSKIFEKKQKNFALTIKTPVPEILRYESSN